jgi:hypothetical protein
MNNLVMLSPRVARGLLLAVIGYASFGNAQSGTITNSVTDGPNTWNVTDGVVQYCNNVNCAAPRIQAPSVQDDAGLYLLPNGGLWILTGDGHYQIFCSNEPNCVPPRTRLAKLNNPGTKYKFAAQPDNRLSVTDPRSGRVTWCSNEPNCIP